MNLKGYIRNSAQVDEAKRLAIMGLLNYQPFIFSDDLELGVGLEFAEGRYIGLVYYPTIDRNLLQSPELRRIIIDPQHYEKFHQANARLRQLYDGFIDEICKAVGDVSETTFLDVGCNSGYFPVSFSLRGAKEAVGCDRENFSSVFKLLNEILGTKAVFIHRYYNSKTHFISRCKAFDVVISTAVLCHLSDPLFHLNFLGSIAKKAIFLWTLVNDDAGHTIHLGEPRNDYKDDSFPICFDNKICLSVKLLYKSFELMGFKKIYEIPEKEGTLPSFSWDGYKFKAMLALR